MPFFGLLGVLLSWLNAQRTTPAARTCAHRRLRAGRRRHVLGRALLIVMAAGHAAVEGCNTGWCTEESSCWFSCDCRRCRAGHWCRDTFEDLCREDEHACAAGQYQPSHTQTSCRACPAGQYQGSTGRTSCISCAAGRASGGAGQASCTVCPTGRYQTSTGSTSCSTCSSGRFNSDTASTSQSSCRACQAGQYNSNTARASWSLRSLAK